MIIEKNIYPYNKDAQNLPFFLAGIGGSSFQQETLRPQGYQWHQILCCYEETGILECDGETTELVSGQYLFLPKNTPHHYYPVNNKWGVCWLAFEGSNCDETLNKLHMDKPIIISPPSDAKLNVIFEKMVHSLETDFLYCDYTCSGLLYDFILEFHRYTSSSTDSERSHIISLLMPVLRFMHDNYSKDFSMVELSNLINITPEHFSRIFKKAMLTTPTDFLTNIRINEAKLLLSDVKNSITYVANKTGFNDANYFSTVFKKYVGISPSEYRKQLK